MCLRQLNSFLFAREKQFNYFYKQYQLSYDKILRGNIENIL